jgi:hypothetical protein
MCRFETVKLISSVFPQNSGKFYTVLLKGPYAGAGRTIRARFVFYRKP